MRRVLGGPRKIGGIAARTTPHIPTTVKLRFYYEIVMINIEDKRREYKVLRFEFEDLRDVSGNRVRCVLEPSGKPATWIVFREL
jgi:hypothetical protein